MDAKGLVAGWCELVGYPELARHFREAPDFATAWNTCQRGDVMEAFLFFDWLHRDARPDLVPYGTKMAYLDDMGAINEQCKKEIEDSIVQIEAKYKPARTEAIARHADRIRNVMPSEEVERELERVAGALALALAKHPEAI